MDNFKLRELKNTNNEKELESIGFDSSYRFRAVEKMDSRLIKVYSLTSAQANILKQTAISIGADCLTHREVITGKVELSDAIITANTAEIKKLSQKLLFQPLGLKNLAGQLLEFCDKQKRSTKLVGILNLTSDSFSDGGRYLDIESAIAHFDTLINDGADCIDIGAESTRPGSQPVDAKVQLERLLPILEHAKCSKSNINISIDTRSHVVAEEVLKLGNYIINDVSGFEFDKKMPLVLAKYNAKTIIQHSYSTPDVMQNNPIYNDVVEDVYMFLREKVKFANEIGLTDIIVDPGIGFGKTKQHNHEILTRVEEFYSLGCPVMVGVSRKSMLGIEGDDNNLKDIMTLALNSRLIEKGVDYLRVHNVKLHKDFFEKTLGKIEKNS